MENKQWCSKCEEYVEPDYITKACVAQYGSVVFAKGYCPFCNHNIVKEHMVDDDGLREPRGGHGR